MSTLETNIKSIRKARHVSQSELAKAIGVHTGTVSHWENGKQLPDTYTIKKIADYLGVPIGELLGGVSLDSADYQEDTDVNLEELVAQLKTLNRESLQIIAPAIRAAYEIEKKRAKGVYQPSAKIETTENIPPK